MVETAPRLALATAMDEMRLAARLAENPQFDEGQRAVFADRRNELAAEGLRIAALAGIAFEAMEVQFDPAPQQELYRFAQSRDVNPNLADVALGSLHQMHRDRLLDRATARPLDQSLPLWLTVDVSKNFSGCAVDTASLVATLRQWHTNGWPAGYDLNEEVVSLLSDYCNFVFPHLQEPLPSHVQRKPEGNVSLGTMLTLDDLEAFASQNEQYANDSRAAKKAALRGLNALLRANQQAVAGGIELPLRVALRHEANQQVWEIDDQSLLQTMQLLVEQRIRDPFRSSDVNFLIEFCNYHFPEARLPLIELPRRMRHRRPENPMQQPLSLDQIVSRVEIDGATIEVVDSACLRNFLKSQGVLDVISPYHENSAFFSALALLVESEKWPPQTGPVTDCFIVRTYEKYPGKIINDWGMPLDRMPAILQTLDGFARAKPIRYYRAMRKPLVAYVETVDRLKSEQAQQIRPASEPGR